MSIITLCMSCVRNITEDTINEQYPSLYTVVVVVVVCVCVCVYVCVCFFLHDQQRVEFLQELVLLAQCFLKTTHV